jgi:hypothetical protein
VLLNGDAFSFVHACRMLGGKTPSVKQGGHAGSIFGE